MIALSLRGIGSILELLTCPADGTQVLFHTCRPLLAIRDPTQLAPTLKVHIKGQLLVATAEYRRVQAGLFLKGTGILG